jgi:hypothetical protein
MERQAGALLVSVVSRTMTPLAPFPTCKVTSARFSYTVVAVGGIWMLLTIERRRL